MNISATAQRDNPPVAIGTSGWAGMANKFREVDEDKIRDCKEDIDTLLVFAGLFSAVMTAFLIESYTSLSPDRTDMVIGLLSQISSQTSSYTFTANSLNSTIIPPAAILSNSFSFEPPLSALRVNVLWFASLNISLITASFGIMVKQWLREYLAMNYTSPQARLRARRFRLPGLVDWKVFEIAAALPLLLQLSLGLFLLGLCFFTWSVHPSVGKTSVPLVAGWAFLFSVAIIAPIFSARCPYRTVLLHRALKSLRVLLRRRRVMMAAVASLTRLRGSIHPVPTDHSPNSAIPLATYVYGEKTLVSEEEDAVKDDGNDIQFLCETDDLLQDDDLLASSILDSVRQLTSDPIAIMQFVLQCLNHRFRDLQVDVNERAWSGLPDLGRLTKRCWVALTDVAADVIIQHLSQPEPLRSVKLPGEHSWFDSAVAVLFSISNHPLSAHGKKATSLILYQTDAYKRLHNIVLRSPTESRALPHLISKLRHLISLFSSDDSFFCAAVSNILQASFCSDSCTHDSCICESFSAHAAAFPTHMVEDLYGIAIDHVRTKMSSERANRWLDGHQDCVRGLLASGLEVAGNVRKDIVEVMTDLFTVNEYYIPICIVTCVYREVRAPGERSVSTVCALFQEMKPKNRTYFIRNIEAICVATISGWFYKSSRRTGYPLINMVRFCWLVICVYQADLSGGECCPEWASVWDKLPEAVHKFRIQQFEDSDVDWGKEKQVTIKMALDCLSQLQASDLPTANADVPYEDWLKVFKPKKARFSDRLYEELACFVEEAKSSTFYRLKRLRAIQTALPSGQPSPEEPEAISGTEMMLMLQGPEAVVPGGLDGLNGSMTAPPNAQEVTDREDEKRLVEGVSPWMRDTSSSKRTKHHGRE